MGAMTPMVSYPGVTPIRNVAPDISSTTTASVVLRTVLSP
jgi:hypothetical protein